jgi:hypothetical protein
MENQSKLKTFIGIILMPFLASVFILDRLILVCLPHVESVAIQDFFFDKEAIKKTFLRILSVMIGFGLYLIIKLIF